MTKHDDDPHVIIQSILEAVGSMVIVTQIVSHMKQALFYGKDFDDALEACFGAPGPIYANAGQAAEFRRAAGKIWNEVGNEYNRDEDEPKAELRDRLLALMQRQSEWIRSLVGIDTDPESLPREPMQRLGELNAMLGATLHAVEVDAAATQSSRASLLETLATVAVTMENFIEIVENSMAEHIDGDAPWRNSESAPESIFVLRISIDNTHPPVWRRVSVPGDFPLDLLHEVIQDAMGWDDCHSHSFVVDGTIYTLPEDGEQLEDEEDEAAVSLDSLGLHEHQEFEYTYDFGDDWKHTLEVERITAAEEASAEEREYPICLAGKRACPPEDCGGPFGYVELLSLLAAPETDLTEDDIERLEWLGPDFDPEDFDLNEINELLRR